MRSRFDTNSIPGSSSKGNSSCTSGRERQWSAWIGSVLLLSGLSFGCSEALVITETTKRGMGPQAAFAVSPPDSNVAAYAAGHGSCSRRARRPAIRPTTSWTDRPRRTGSHRWVASRTSGCGWSSPGRASRPSTGSFLGTETVPEAGYTRGSPNQSGRANNERKHKDSSSRGAWLRYLDACWGAA